MKCFTKKNDLPRSQLLLVGGLLVIAVIDPAWSQTTTSSAVNSSPNEPPLPIGGTPGAAVANGNAQSVASASGDKGTELIVVTGSRIARPNLESTVPITSISGAEFFQTGKTSIGDILNELPALHSTFTTANSTNNLGTAGLNLLDLRGLGTQRTLVLVNGRRHVAGDILNNAVSPDTNTFPTDLIERVDIVTGGDSAVYGSDAIAGVVNFILKDHFQGLELRGQGAVSEQGLGGSYYASLLAGRNFAGNRGNVAVNAEFAHASDFYASDDSSLNHLDQFVLVDTNSPGLPNGSNGIPDRTFFRDVRSVTTSNGGLVRFGTRQCGKDKFGKPYRCTFLFQPDGTLVPQTGTRIGLAPNGSIIGGNGATRREGNQLGLSPRVDRYAINLIGHFEITPALVPFIEAKFVRTNTLGSSSGPALWDGPPLIIWRSLASHQEERTDDEDADCYARDRPG